jgi:hypothetical protein
VKTTAKRSQWLFSGILASLAAVGTAVLFWFDPARNAFYPTCLFHSATGLLCPGCGSLRALHQLLHGDLAAALRYNPLLVLSLPLFIGCGFVFGMKAHRHQPAPFSLKWIWLYLVVSLVFGLLRNLPAGPFVLLRP